MAIPCPGHPGNGHRQGHGHGNGHGHSAGSIRPSSPSPPPSAQVGTAAAHSCYLCTTTLPIIFGCCWNRSCLQIRSFPGEMGRTDLIPEWFLEDRHRQLSPCLPLRDTRPARGWTAPWHPCPAAGHPGGPRAHPGAGVVPSVVAQAGTELEPLPRSLSAAEPGLSAVKPRQIPQIPLPASLWQRRPSRAV